MDTDSVSVDEVIKQHLPLVKKIAGSLKRRLPGYSTDQLTGSGLFGLYEACNSHDPSKGASFETYAGIKIFRSIMDEMRKNQWSPRSAARFNREQQKAEDAVSGRLLRKATDSEVAKEMGITLHKYHKRLSKTRNSYLLSLDEKISPSSDSLSENSLYGILSNSTPDIEEVMEKEEAIKFLTKSLEEMNPRLKLIIQMYYFDELTEETIGLMLEISGSRVSQLLDKAEAELRVCFEVCYL